MLKYCKTQEAYGQFKTGGALVFRDAHETIDAAFMIDLGPVQFVIRPKEPAEKEAIWMYEERDLAMHHHGLGVWIWNNLGLWGQNPALMKALADGQGAFYTLTPTGPRGSSLRPYGRNLGESRRYPCGKAAHREFKASSALAGICIFAGEIHRKQGFPEEAFHYSPPKATA